MYFHLENLLTLSKLFKEKFENNDPTEINEHKRKKSNSSIYKNGEFIKSELIFFKETAE